MSNAELVEIAQHDALPNYRPPPFVLTRGRGTRVWDADDREYLDFSGGIAVLSVGHAHPKLAAAIGEQAGRLMHTSNLFYNDRAIRLAHEIVRRTGFDRVYFGNSGAEANEALLKLGRRWHHERGDAERVEIVAMKSSFHGRTMGALSMTGQPKYHVGMAPLVGGVHHVPFNDIGALEALVSERTAAVILEPLQGEGGLVLGDPKYLSDVRALCDARGALLFFDEVQTGYGRLGTFLGREHSGVMPDACALAKGMGGGFPIGAIAVREKLANGLPPGSHASTFGGNPLACAAGLAVLEIFDEEKLVDNARAMGERMGAALDAVVREHAAATESRGLGLLRGVRLREGTDATQVITRLRDEQGMLATIAGGDVIRLAPPLNVTADEVDDAVRRLGATLQAVS
ncbi:MAG: aspartate aminotransferase family protein [Sandaracinaceae bacterium]